MRWGRAITLNCNKLPTQTYDKYKSILKEIKSYKATKRLPPTLTDLHNILNIFLPPSIVAEKSVFNSDDTVDAVAYLNLFFKINKVKPIKHHLILRNS